MRAKEAKVILRPDLSRCVHTVAKKEYENTARRLLAEEKNVAGLSARLEILTRALKELDFTELRRQSEPFLIQGKQVTFILYMKSGSPRYEMRIG